MVLGSITNSNISNQHLSDEILRYLLRHPEAQDTVDGLTEWWLLEQQMTKVLGNVESVLAKLVKNDFVVATPHGDGRVLYQLNRKMEREVRRYLRNRGENSSAGLP